MNEKVEAILASFGDLQLSELRAIRHLLDTEIDERQQRHSGHSFVDLIPIDGPLEVLKAQEKNELRLKFPFSLSADDLTRWREIQITYAAQVELITILAKHLSEGGKVESIQLPKKTLQ